ncbi:MAG: DNA alkylation repair protein [Fimbriimonadaceae bacterium]|nr:DNA alkylation repair protein [Fimbriimonadaceae bacterium]QYK58718.1 MAG: DNA alkylation repair protein [Fimbriimonadaceae bacterium]
MTAQEVVQELESLGTPQIKKIWLKYGAAEPCFGVKVEDMKKILKRVKGDHQLALDLYETGIADAMYLAGLLVDDSKMTESELDRWLAKAQPGWVADFTVPWVAGSSPVARSIALRWIGSTDPKTAAAGWGTYSSHLSITPDDKIDLDEVSGLLERAKTELHRSPDPVKAAMNQFVTFVGCYVLPLHEAAQETARAIGPVTVDPKNSCSLAPAVDQIAKFAARGAIGRKRKSAKC